MKTKNVILFWLFLATTTVPAMGQSAGTKLWEFAASPRLSVDPMTGETRPLPAYIFSSPAVGAEQTLYFGSGNGELYALSPAGQKKWSFQTGAEIQSSPAIGRDAYLKRLESAVKAGAFKDYVSKPDEAHLLAEDRGWTTGTFTLLSPRVLAQFDAYNGGAVASTVTASCAGSPTVTSVVPGSSLMRSSWGRTRRSSIPPSCGSLSGIQSGSSVQGLTPAARRSSSGIHVKRARLSAIAAQSSSRRPIVSADRGPTALKTPTRWCSASRRHHSARSRTSTNSTGRA